MIKGNLENKIQELKKTILEGTLSTEGEEILEDLESNTGDREVMKKLFYLIEETDGLSLGMPGPIVRFLEGYFREGYEGELKSSLRRKPTMYGVWMLNRLVNGTEGEEREEYVELMKNVMGSGETRAEVKDYIRDFYGDVLMEKRKEEVEKKMVKVCELYGENIEEETEVKNGVGFNEEGCFKGFYMGNLPKDYLWFLRRFGRWSVMANIEGFRYIKGELVFEPINITNYRVQGGLPEGNLVISDEGEYQVCICLEDGKIYSWSEFDSEGLEFRYDTFLDYLDDVLEDTILDFD